jgi:Na+-driven multidrug efflux pump
MYLYGKELFMNLESIRKNEAQTILQFSVPAIIAMLLTSLITIADGFFTGNYVGKEGIAAINLGLPIVYLYLGLGYDICRRKCTCGYGTWSRGQ